VKAIRHLFPHVKVDSKSKDEDIAHINLIEAFHSTLGKSIPKRGRVRTTDTLQIMHDAVRFRYNFLMKHSALEMTPAERAGIQYSCGLHFNGLLKFAERYMARRRDAMPRRFYAPKKASHLEVQETLDHIVVRATRPTSPSPETRVGGCGSMAGTCMPGSTSHLPNDKDPPVQPMRRQPEAPSAPESGAISVEEPPIKGGKLVPIRRGIVTSSHRQAFAILSQAAARGPLKTPEAVKLLQERMRISKATAQRYIKLLITRGFIDRTMKSRFKNLFELPSP
jgi:hypothetical protein